MHQHQTILLHLILHLTDFFRLVLWLLVIDKQFRRNLLKMKITSSFNYGYLFVIFVLYNFQISLGTNEIEVSNNRTRQEKGKSLT